MRDGDSKDYCWRAAVQSLLEVCDTVTICDGGSTDGTMEAALDWSRRESRVRVIHFPWPNPKGEPHFWVSWLNWCRELIHNFWHIQLDADEVLYESSIPWILEFTKEKRLASAWCERINFFGDLHHTIPRDKVCGWRVARLASQSLWMPTDYPHPDGEELCRIAVESPVKIAHYGFVRRLDALFAKSKDYQGWTMGSYDSRLVEVEAKGSGYKGIEASSGWTADLWQGSQPKAALPWLKERGLI